MKNLRTLAEGMLFAIIVLQTISAFMYTLEGSDLWFSRFALAAICLGLLYAGSKKEVS